MIEEHGIHIERYSRSDEPVDDGRHAEYFDSLVCVRSPYTGVLAPPGPTDNVPQRDSVASMLFSDDIGVGAAKETVSLDSIRALTDRARISWNRFRFALASFATAVCAGFVVFAMMDFDSDPLPNNDSRPDLKSEIGQVPTIVQTKHSSDQKTTPDVGVPVAGKVLDRSAVSSIAPEAPVKIEATGVASKPATTPTVKGGVARGISSPAATPETSKVTPKVANDAYDEVLLKVRQSRQNKQRMTLLREAIALNPEGDEAMARLSILLMENPQSRREALSLAERAAQINGDNAMAWLAIGYIKQLNGAIKEAKAAYGRCATAPGPQKFVRDCRSLI